MDMKPRCQWTVILNLTRPTLQSHNRLELFDDVNVCQCHKHVNLLHLLSEDLHFPDCCAGGENENHSDTKKAKVSGWAETRVSKPLLQTQPVLLLHWVCRNWFLAHSGSFSDAKLHLVYTFRYHNIRQLQSVHLLQLRCYLFLWWISKISIFLTFSPHSCTSFQVQYKLMSFQEQISACSLCHYST